MPAQCEAFCYLKLSLSGHPKNNKTLFPFGGSSPPFLYQLAINLSLPL
ncbi:hypothetical protein VCRA2121O157_110096 [Vibrio crassostreae]|nr:hypothetical protein VCRA2113O137_110065 [Vibrio crassostreae]CAK1782647.1 hypothetical protein VCRA2113O138_160041 [Vibrio crassostreae]CAK1902082.1 hypothetical protein VCRA2114E123_220060 [Vibrio crassostreae]CAK1913550.1 hypothetical protein VCRA2113O120_240003 [Vibrio crassostreae]CAK1922304.1 hypothetical protein VCRA2114E122_240060 [Vibrio crassostreae]